MISGVAAGGALVSGRLGGKKIEPSAFSDDHVQVTVGLEQIHSIIKVDALKVDSIAIHDLIPGSESGFPGQAPGFGGLDKDAGTAAGAFTDGASETLVTIEVDDDSGVHQLLRWPENEEMMAGQLMKTPKDEPLSQWDDVIVDGVNGLEGDNCSS